MSNYKVEGASGRNVAISFEGVCEAFENLDAKDREEFVSLYGDQILTTLNPTIESYLKDLGSSRDLSGIAIANRSLVEHLGLDWVNRWMAAEGLKLVRA